nr:transposase, MuDR, MULE transposase domain protein [Tanacetum cinerariifolium]
MNQGFILHDDLTYTMLHEMVMKKFNLEASYPLNLSAKLFSIDDNFDITDDDEVRFFVEYACNSEDEAAHLHAAIALAVHNKFPLAHHVVCCHHLMMNLSLKRDKTNALFWKICKAYTTKEFSSSMSYLQDIHPDAYDKLCQEVLKLAETYRAMMQDWYYKRRKLAGTCQCRKWKLSELSCGHVIAVTRYLGLTECVQFVSDWFKKPKYQGTYAEPIYLIGNVQEWEFPQHIRKAIPPRMDNPQPSRPKNTNRIQSQGLVPLADALQDHNLLLINSENVRSNVLMKLQEALDEEGILEEQILTLMHRFADRFTDRRVEINNLVVLQDHPLIDYGKYVLGCMTGADMKECVHLKSVRDELLGSMEEKIQLMTNYKDM